MVWCRLADAGDRVHDGFADALGVGEFPAASLGGVCLDAGAVVAVGNAERLGNVQVGRQGVHQADDIGPFGQEHVQNRTGGQVSGVHGAHGGRLPKMLSPALGHSLR